MKKISSKIKAIVICLATVICTLANVGIVANATEAEGSQVAIIEISDYTIDGGMLDSGKQITVNLTLHNTGASASANSVMMTISSESGMVYPVYGNDNQVYVGNIGAGRSKEVSIPLTIGSNFMGDSVDLTCQFDYETAGAQMTNSATLIIPKSGGSTIGVKTISVSSHAIVNGKSLLSISYVNQSASNINDARLVVDGNVSKNSKNIKLDTIYSGKSYTEDFYVTFKKAGEQTVNVKLVYTDADGEEKTNDLGTFGVTVSKEAASENNNSTVNVVLTWVGRVIAAFGLMAALAVVFIYIKKR